MFPLDPASSILREHVRMMILLSHNDLVILWDLFTQLSSGYAGLRGVGMSQKGKGVCSLWECGQAQRRMEERMGKRDAGPLRKVSSVQETRAPHQQTGQHSPGKHETELSSPAEPHFQEQAETPASALLLLWAEGSGQWHRDRMWPRVLRSGTSETKAAA